MRVVVLFFYLDNEWSSLVGRRFKKRMEGVGLIRVGRSLKRGLWDFYYTVGEGLEKRSARVLSIVLEQ